MCLRSFFIDCIGNVPTTSIWHLCGQMIELADFSGQDFNQERIGRFDSAIYPDGNQAVALSHTAS